MYHFENHQIIIHGSSYPTQNLIQPLEEGGILKQFFPHFSLRQNIFILDIWASEIYILMVRDHILQARNLVKIFPDIWACILTNSQVLMNFYWVKAEDLVHFPFDCTLNDRTIIYFTTNLVLGSGFSLPDKSCYSSHGNNLPGNEKPRTTDEACSIVGQAMG